MHSAEKSKGLRNVKLPEVAKGQLQQLQRSQLIDFTKLEETMPDQTNGDGVKKVQQGGFPWPKMSCESGVGSSESASEAVNQVPGQDNCSNGSNESYGASAQRDRLERESQLAGMTTRELVQSRQSKMFGIGQSSASSNSSILGEMTVSMDGGAVLTSSGLLDNREEVSKAVTQAVKLLALYKPTKSDTSLDAANSSQEDKHTVSYKKLSFVYSDRAYVVVRSGNKLHVTLKKVEERSNIGDLMTHDDDSEADSDLSDNRSLS